MAFEADCGVSTVLEASYVTRTAEPPVEKTLRGPRDEALRDSATPTGGSGWGMTTGVELIPKPA